MRVWGGSRGRNEAPDPWWDPSPSARRGGVWYELRSVCGRPWTFGIAHVTTGGTSLCRYRSEAIWESRPGLALTRRG